MVKKYIINYHKNHISISEKQISTNEIYDFLKVYSSKKGRGRYEVYFYAYPQEHFQKQLDKSLEMIHKQIDDDFKTIINLKQNFLSASNQLKQQIMKGL